MLHLRRDCLEECETQRRKYREVSLVHLYTVTLVAAQEWWWQTGTEKETKEEGRGSGRWWDSAVEWSKAHHSTSFVLEDSKVVELCDFVDTCTAGWEGVRSRGSVDLVGTARSDLLLQRSSGRRSEEAILTIVIISEPAEYTIGWLHFVMIVMVVL